MAFHLPTPGAGPGRVFSLAGPGSRGRTSRCPPADTQGRPQPGHGRWAAACCALRRQSQHNLTSLPRTGCPHWVHTREHSTHRSVSAWRIRGFPQPGQAALAAASVILRQHRQQCSGCRSTPPAGRRPSAASTGCSRPSGGGFKPPLAALAEDCRGERRGKAPVEGVRRGPGRRCAESPGAGCRGSLLRRR